MFHLTQQQAKYEQNAFSRVKGATGGQNNYFAAFDQTEEWKQADINLSSETTAKLPPNTARTTIGVGEEVTVTASIPVIWDVKSNLIKEISRSETHFMFQAQYKAGSVSIMAKKDDGKQKSITFSIITPTEVKYKKTQDIHIKDVLDSGFKANIFFAPDSVNFYAIQYAEVESFAKASGLLAEGNGLPHGNYSEESNVQGHLIKHSSFRESTNNVVKGLGTQATGDDLIYFGENEYFEPLREEGKLEITIKFLWKLPASSIHELPKPVIQTTTITSNGQVTTKKANAQTTFHYKAASVGTDLLGSNALTPKPRQRK